MTGYNQIWPRCSAPPIAKDLIAQILAFSHQGPQQECKPVQLQPIAKETLKLVRVVLPTTIEIDENLAGRDCPRCA